MCSKLIIISLNTLRIIQIKFVSHRPILLKFNWNSKYIKGYTKCSFSIKDFAGPPLCFLQSRWWRSQLNPAQLPTRQWWMARGLPRSPWQWDDAKTGRWWRSAGGHRIRGAKQRNHHRPHSGHAGKHLPLWNQQELPRSVTVSCTVIKKQKTARLSWR